MEAMTEAEMPPSMMAEMVPEVAVAPPRPSRCWERECGENKEKNQQLFGQLPEHRSCLYMSRYSKHTSLVRHRLDALERVLAAAKRLMATRTGFPNQNLAVDNQPVNVQQGLDPDLAEVAVQPGPRFLG